MSTGRFNKTAQAADKAAAAIQSAKIQAGELSFMANSLGERLEKMEAALIEMRGSGLFTGDEVLSTGLRKLNERVTVMRQLKNQMELGSFSIQANRLLDEAWRQLP